MHLTGIFWGLNMSSSWLVPDNTIHKDTSKYHKTNKKIAHFAVHVSPSIFENFGRKSTTPSTLSKMQCVIFFKSQCQRKNVHHCFQFFCLIPTAPKSYLFVELSFSALSWYTPKEDWWEISILSFISWWRIILPRGLSSSV